ncbi:arginine deiminase-related protein [Mesorhizobium sp. VK23B]|uniref:Arginine deiminase-related protein n=1 Tax=Mesorhizobium dulcispinae TaxID=3072316 RepID=A0ABU4XMZ3_9HYPH|nr:MULTISPECIES: arginine deiminase-related protein [unclassified Mesorhizobium]MDX8469765.1 arginine deiminase-related protein [Mesorhizobium sp. VK23B]MDX8476104.1 arginine deiminase-related protein [Mesorhizobium sp. VK23A]
MVRPHRFTVNIETAADNRFQISHEDAGDLSPLVYAEITRAAALLREQGIVVHLFESEDRDAPDSVFPNNWFSTHAGGYVAIYPMKALSRRRERRSDIIDMLKSRYRVQEVIDYSGLEPDGLFLEGTGSMVLDHIDRVAYAARSERTDPIALEKFCAQFSFEPMVFSAKDSSGFDIYHTNVLMCVATDFAMIGLDMVTDLEIRCEIVHRLGRTGRRVIALTNTQIEKFAGNSIELLGADGRILALSTTALLALTTDQIDIIGESARLLPLAIPTVERAGGSVRCTIAGVHLTPRG